MGFSRLSSSRKRTRPVLVGKQEHQREKPIASPDIPSWCQQSRTHETRHRPSRNAARSFTPFGGGIVNSNSEVDFTEANEGNKGSRDAAIGTGKFRAKTAPLETLPASFPWLPSVNSISVFWFRATRRTASSGGPPAQAAIPERASQTPRPPCARPARHGHAGGFAAPWQTWAGPAFHLQT